MLISKPHAAWWHQLQQECQHDPYYSALGSIPHAILRDGVWFSKGKVLLNPTSALVPTILAECHASPTGGHFGVHKTISRLRCDFRWPVIRRTVLDYIWECEICQQCKTDCMSPVGLLQPLPVPDCIWTDISMDFIEGLLISKGYSVIMVVVDRISKYAHFVALSHPFTATSVATTFVINVVRLHGLPSSIVSDMYKVFLSSFWKNLFRLQGTWLCMSSSYHPQSDGQTEVVNLTLEQYLRFFVSTHPRRWIDWLPWAEYSYNTSFHSSTGISPLEAVYGIPQPSILTYVPGTSRLEAVDTHLRDRDAILKDLRSHLLVARDRMCSYANQRRRCVTFAVGDFVYLKLQPYRQSLVVFRATLKLSDFGTHQSRGISLSFAPRIPYSQCFPCKSITKTSWSSSLCFSAVATHDREGHIVTSAKDCVGAQGGPKGTVSTTDGHSR